MVDALHILDVDNADTVDDGNLLYDGAGNGVVKVDSVASGLWYDGACGGWQTSQCSCHFKADCRLADVGTGAIVHSCRRRPLETKLVMIRALTKVGNLEELLGHFASP